MNYLDEGRDTNILAERALLKDQKVILFSLKHPCGIQTVSMRYSVRYWMTVNSIQKKPAMNVMTGSEEYKKGVAYGPRILTFREAS